MSYQVKQPSVGAALGAGIGKGLSEQIPQEIQQYRLSQGLQKFAKENPDSPLIQQYANLLKIPGVRESPQLLQTFGDLARTGALAKELGGQGGIRPEDFTQPERPPAPKDKEAPSITESAGVEETRKPYIPPTPDERKRIAAQKYPQIFARDPMAALALVDKDIEQEIQRSEAIQATRPKQADIQKQIRSELVNMREKLGIPAEGVAGNFYSKIEDKAVRAVLPEEVGGEGLTEVQAAKKYAQELEEWNRDYNTIKSWGGGFTMGPWNRNKVQDQIESVRETFKKRGDLENFADLLVAETGLSNDMAYFKAFPPKDYDVFKELKPLQKITGGKQDLKEKRSKEVIPRIAKNIGNASPLAVAKYLDLKGYDSDMFLNYLRNNEDIRNGLNKIQDRQLGKSRVGVSNLSDIWFSVFSGEKRLLGE